MALQVDQPTLDILDRAILSGRALQLTGQLDCKSYERVAKVIEAAGGKWDRKTKSHQFEGPAEAAIEPILLSGQVTSAKQEFGAFYTPADLAEQVVAAADLSHGMSVLEPSAGRGALAAPAFLSGCLVDCVEIAPKSVAILCSTAYRQVIEADFLSLDAVPQYDRVVMNPPFARQQDIAHVQHAFGFLIPGGKLVAITSAGVLFRTDRNTTEFREFVEAQGGRIERLPDSSFRASGTQVNTALVTVPA